MRQILQKHSCPFACIHYYIYRFVSLNDFYNVAGITLSKSQVKRGGELAAEQGLGNCRFQVMDALHMDFPDDSFDLVWACESGEHMPDKKAYIEEMTRVLKPGEPESVYTLEEYF